MVDLAASGSTSPTALAHTLRRKRSSANAALTSRPSHLNLRDNLQPSLNTIVLVHTSTAPADAGGATTLVRALMEPNFLIDSQGRVTRLDRETWERVRDSVEALRIVGTSSSTISSLPTPDQSPNLSLPISPQHQANARTFDVGPNSAPRGSRATSTLLMQPRLQTATTEDSLTSPSELLAFVVHGVGAEPVDIDEAAWSSLPTQIRVLLNEAGHLQKTYAPGPLGEPGVCDAILRLVRG
ncbi:hypothetical protein V8E36_000384 [Tilletia maclaganii]